MVNKKLLLIPLIVLVLAGCNKNDDESQKHNYSSYIDYTLTLDEKITENIDIYMPINAIELANESSEESAPNDEYTFINTPLYPILDNYELTYNKSKLETKNNSKYLNLNTELNYTNILKSTNLNNCFAYSDIKDEGDYISVALSGEFRCLYGNEVTINVKGNNIVNTNLEKISNNHYRKIINSENNNEEIYLSFSKISDNKTSNNVFKTFYIIIAGILVIATLLILLILKKSNSYE